MHRFVGEAIQQLHVRRQRVGLHDLHRWCAGPGAVFAGRRPKRDVEIIHAHERTG
jgi:hypothetical protein